eukprot:2858354-Rhodomonas_salina.1
MVCACQFMNRRGAIEQKQEKREHLSKMAIHVPFHVLGPAHAQSEPRISWTVSSTPSTFHELEAARAQLVLHTPVWHTRIAEWAQTGTELGVGDHGYGVGDSRHGIGSSGIGIGNSGNGVGDRGVGVGGSGVCHGTSILEEERRSWSLPQMWSRTCPDQPLFQISLIPDQPLSQISLIRAHHAGACLGYAHSGERATVGPRR